APEAQMDGDIRCVARPHGTVAPFRRSASLHFFEAKEFVALVGKPRARVRRENESACTIRPRDSGGGGPLELAQRANRGGGGAGRGASFSLQIFLFARRRERASENVWAPRRLLRRVESCAPSTTPSAYALRASADSNPP